MCKEFKGKSLISLHMISMKTRQNPCGYNIFYLFSSPYLAALMRTFHHLGILNKFHFMVKMLFVIVNMLLRVLMLVKFCQHLIFGCLLKMIIPFILIHPVITPLVRCPCIICNGLQSRYGQQTIPPKTEQMAQIVTNDALFLLNPWPRRITIGHIHIRHLGQLHQVITLFPRHMISHRCADIPRVPSLICLLCKAATLFTGQIPAGLSQQTIK